MDYTKYNDVSAIIQVIGTVYNHPEILDQTDKYILNEDDFINDFHKIVYGSIYKLYNLGAKKITVQDILNFLSYRSEYEAIFIKNKGETWLAKASATAEYESFDFYYNRVKKMSLLRSYAKYGIDVSFIYDAENIMDIKKLTEQTNWLDAASLVDIVERVDKKIDDIKLSYVSNDYGASYEAGDGIVDLIDSLKASPEVGIPLYGKFVNTIHRGARLGKFYLRSAATGIGKAIPDYTLIPTPNGMKTVDKIQVGDYLFGDDGLPTKVLARYPQPEKKYVYKLYLEDGRIAECCAEHLWGYRENGSELLVDNTLTLMKKISEGKEIEIPMNKPVFYPAAELEISPTEMGIKILRDRLDYVPTKYFYSSYQQRIEMLSVLVKPHPEIIDPEEQFYWLLGPIVEDLIRLSFSLGLEIKINSKSKQLYFKAPNFVSVDKIIKTEEKVSMTCFTVDNESHLFLMNDFIVTHNTRALIADACYIACPEFYEDGKWEQKSSYPTLFIATEQDLQEVQTMMLSFVANVNEEHILYGKYEVGEEERVYKAAKILQNSPLYIETIPDFSLQDIENIIKKNIREHQIVACFYDYIHTSMKILEEITRRSGGVKLREDNILFMLSNRLKDICNQYHIFLESSTQLNGNYVDSDTPDQNLLRGAKSIADKIDVGSLMLTATQTDQENLLSLISNNGFDKPTIKISVYKNRRGRYKGIYIWCKNELGTCRIKPIFVTDYMYNLIDMPDLKIESAF